LKEIAVEPDNFPGRILYGVGPRVGENNTDYRERLARLQAEALERRRQELHEQSSPLNAPAARIRIWERLHQVELPRDLAHRLIGVVAAHTGLSIEEVRDEQRRRANPPEAPKPDVAP
jgi:hypothetical protein